ncbi:MAG: hypothetical protein JKY11_07305 [Alphaproteobacteria bacterium]|nr:hypothetical protein [Alphaproteobacteria bacterium]
MISNEEEIIEEVNVGKPESLPEKFWDEKTQQVRLDSLVKSYAELEKKLSGSMARPKTEEDKINLLGALGRPETAEEYSVNLEHGLFDIDPELNQRLHGLGFTQDQVQAVYDAAAEKLVPIVLDLSAEFQADREVDRLVQEFGGADKWQEVSRQLLAFGQKNLPEDVLDSLSASYDGVMTLFQMMKGQDPSFGTKNSVSGVLDETALKSMMKDPKYWKDKDPAFIAKVTEGFEGIYSN